MKLPILSILAMFLMSSHSLAENDATSGHLNLGSMIDYAPYNFHNDDGGYTGIDTEIVESVLNELGLAYSHRPVPWKRALNDFKIGKTQLLFQLSASKERFRTWHMVGPFRKNVREYFVHKDSPIKDIKKLEDLEGLTVGTIAGYNYPKEFENSYLFVRSPAVDLERNIFKLKANRIDIVLENSIPFWYYIKENNLEGEFRSLPTPASIDFRYIAFPRTDFGGRLAIQFQKTLDKQIAEGKIDEIIESWID